MVDQSTGKMKVLIIDDESDFCELMSDEFENGGYSTVSAQDATTALTLLDDTIDVVLSDLKLPGEGGTVIIQKLQELPEDQRPFIFFISGVFGDEESTKYIIESSEYFFTKSSAIELSTVVSAITKIIKFKREGKDIPKAEIKAMLSDQDQVIAEEVSTPAPTAQQPAVTAASVAPEAAATNTTAPAPSIPVMEITPESIPQIKTTSDEALKILLVDDEQEILSLLQSEFVKEGYIAKTASCGADAIKMLKEEEFDAIFSDYKMPNGNGMTILDEIKAIPEGEHVPIFFFSSGQADVSANESLQAGAKAFYTKPFDMDDLIVEITQTIKTTPKRQHKEKVTGETDAVNILLVDDEQDILDLLQEEFSAAGYATMTATSGQEAIEQIKIFDFDAIFADFKMPNGNGMSILDEIKQYPESRRVPVFFFCSGQADVSIRESLAAGAKGFYTKPFTLTNLISEVTEIIEKSSENATPAAPETDSEYESDNLRKLMKKREDIIARERDLLNIEAGQMIQEESIYAKIIKDKTILTHELQALIEKENELLAEEREELKLIKSKVDNKEKEVLQKEMEVVAKENEIISKKNDMMTRGESLSRREKAITEREKELTSREEALTKQETEQKKSVA